MTKDITIQKQVIRCFNISAPTHQSWDSWRMKSLLTRLFLLCNLLWRRCHANKETFSGTSLFYIRSEIVV